MDYNQIGFISDLSYSSISAAEFRIKPLTIQLSNDYQTDPPVVQATTGIGDFSAFDGLFDQGFVMTELPYETDLMGSPLTYRGDTFDLFFNPIPVVDVNEIARAYIFTGTRASDGRQRKFIHREPFGSSTGISTILDDLDVDNNAPLTPGTHDTDQGIFTNQAIFFMDGGSDGTNRYYQYGVSQMNQGFSESTVFSGDQAEAEGTIITYTDFSYIATGHGDNQFRLVQVNNRNSQDDALGIFTSPTGSTPSQAMAAVRVGDNIIVAYDGVVYRFDGALAGLTATQPTVIGNYSGYWIERMIWDSASNNIYFLGDVGTTGVLPASFNSLRVYKTSPDFSDPIVELGSIKSVKFSNKRSVPFPGSRLFMFSGCDVDVVLDAETDTLVATNTVLSAPDGILGNGWQIAGVSRPREASTSIYLIIKQNTVYDDYSPQPYSFFQIQNNGN